MRRPQSLKKSPTCFDKTVVFTQYHQNKWEIFSNSEKLDFNLKTRDTPNQDCSFIFVF